MVRRPVVNFHEPLQTVFIELRSDNFIIGLTNVTPTVTSPTVVSLVRLALCSKKSLGLESLKHFNKYFGSMKGGSGETHVRFV